MELLDQSLRFAQFGAVEFSSPMKLSKYLVIGSTAFVLLCTSSCGLFLTGLGDGSGQPEPWRWRNADAQYNEWCNELPRFIIPRMCAYYQLHPERFKPTGNGEEIEIKGFAEFVKNEGYFKLKGGYHSTIRFGIIHDPWGDPLHFVQDLNMDGYIEFGGDVALY